MNDQTIYSPPADLSVVLLREEPRWRLEGHDDLQLIAHALSTTTHQIRALLPDLDRNGSGEFKSLRLQEAELEDEDDREEPYYELYLQQENSVAEQVMCSLSGSELGLLLIDFACALARTKAASTTTLLLLDVASLPFTRQTMKPLANFIAKQKYQTLMVVTDTQIDKQKLCPNAAPALIWYLAHLTMLHLSRREPLPLLVRLQGSPGLRIVGTMHARARELLPPDRDARLPKSFTRPA